jgi:hypothetical protein
MVSKCSCGRWERGREKEKRVSDKKTATNIGSAVFEFKKSFQNRRVRAIERHYETMISNESESSGRFWFRLIIGNMLMNYCTATLYQ